MENPARSPSAVSQDTFWRTLQTFNVTRIVIAVVLFGYLVLNMKVTLAGAPGYLYLEISAAYVLAAVLFAVISGFYRHRFLLQLTAEVLADIIVISMLYILVGGEKSGLAILYLFPLAGSAILTPLSLALFFASLVTLILLADSGYLLLQAGDQTISQAGLYGAAFFAAVFVLNRLAAKLINQEKLAAQRGRDLQVQQAINRLVLADMGDGILVVDQDGTIFTANPAAERMLGLPAPESICQQKLQDNFSLLPIAEAFTIWVSGIKNGSRNPDVPTYVLIQPRFQQTNEQSGNWMAGRGVALHLKLRFARVLANGADTGRTVIFMQDFSEIENQAQQLKLASMGRLTASIAHEVRNPLSAISYAASLMGEEVSDPAQSRLISIVSDNVTRLNRMIEDILKLSRKAHPHAGPIDLVPLLDEILDEFEKTHNLEKDLIQLRTIGQYRAWFDPLHFREVVVNLLSNAVRYASGRPGSIRLNLVSNAANRLELHVQDDGPIIAPEVRAHLFEPFYTTSSKGTGLGLYLARELCLNNGAMLDYEYRMTALEHGTDEAGGRFVVTLAPPDERTSS